MILMTKNLPRPGTLSPTTMRSRSPSSSPPHSKLILSKKESSELKIASLASKGKTQQQQVVFKHLITRPHKQTNRQTQKYKNGQTKKHRNQIGHKQTTKTQKQINKQPNKQYYSSARDAGVQCPRISSSAPQTSNEQSNRKQANNKSTKPST